MDLLVWILKYEGAEDPTGMRTLQLPPCLRRLCGIILVGEIRPHVGYHRSGRGLRGEVRPHAADYKSERPLCGAIVQCKETKRVQNSK